MVQLDLSALRYLSKEDFRVLTAIEMGMKNHHIVPTQLIGRIAGLKSGVYKVIKNLHKHKLVFHDSKHYDGYRLTYSGYDHLAVKALVKRGHIAAVGRRIGVGKESDIYEVYDDNNNRLVLKVHRLGRVSFRSVKNNRDYHGKRQHASWLYLSRLAALREYAYMKALYQHGFPTPMAIDHNRHCVLMSLVDGLVFSQVRKLKRPSEAYNNLMNLIVRLAEHGLIHCDFNEFNLMLLPNESFVLIDFPQMVSTSHENADMYFDRDVQCIRTYFLKRYKFESDEYPRLNIDTQQQIDLDVSLQASGVATKEDLMLNAEQRHALEKSLEDNNNNNNNNDEIDEYDDDEYNDEDEEDRNDNDDDDNEKVENNEDEVENDDNVNDYENNSDDDEKVDDSLATLNINDIEINKTQIQKKVKRGQRYRRHKGRYGRSNMSKKNRKLKAEIASNVW